MMDDATQLRLINTLADAERELEEARQERDRWYGKAIERANAFDERDTLKAEVAGLEATVRQQTARYQVQLEDEEKLEAEVARLRSAIDDAGSGD